MDNIAKDPFDHILPYIVSLSSIHNQDLMVVPEGSGILVKFSVETLTGQDQVYGVLTAYHVLEKLGLLSYKKALFVDLSKQIDREGNVCGLRHSIYVIYLDFDKKHFRRIIENHRVKEEDDKFERDVAFIGLFRGSCLSGHQFFEHSDFYDLDTYPQSILPKRHQASLAFFRGACLDSEVNDNVLATSMQYEIGGEVRYFSKSGICYHDIPNTRGKSMKGASGTGLWRFYLDNNEIKKQLQGIIVRQDYEEDGKNNRIFAIDISYILNDFLPKLKQHIQLIDKHELRLKLLQIIARRLSCM